MMLNSNVLVIAFSVSVGAPLNSPGDLSRMIFRVFRGSIYSYLAPVPIGAGAIQPPPGREHTVGDVPRIIGLDAPAPQRENATIAAATGRDRCLLDGRRRGGTGQ